MTIVGYMLNTYDEYGPEKIAVFLPDADLRVELLEYCKSLNWVANSDTDDEVAALSKWLSDANRVKNEAYNLSKGWGGVQITELAVR